MSLVGALTNKRNASEENTLPGPQEQSINVSKSLSVTWDTDNVTLTIVSYCSCKSIHYSNLFLYPTALLLTNGIAIITWPRGLS